MQSFESIDLSLRTCEKYERLFRSCCPGGSWLSNYKVPDEIRSPRGRQVPDEIQSPWKVKRQNEIPTSIYTDIYILCISPILDWTPLIVSHLLRSLANYYIWNKIVSHRNSDQCFTSLSYWLVMAENPTSKNCVCAAVKLRVLMYTEHGCSITDT